MPTVLEVANDALAQVASDASLILVAKWVADRYQELVSRVRFRHLRQVGEFLIPPVYSVGTVKVAQGSRTILFNPPAPPETPDAGVSDPLFAGRYFRARGRMAWYQIASAPPGVLLLKTPFAEFSADAVGYDIAPRFVPLHPQARWLGAFIFSRRRRPLTLLQPDELELLFPDRRLISTGPQVYAEVGVDPETSGRLIEVYPYSQQSEMIHYVYWARPDPPLRLHDPLPFDVDPYVLREGVLIDLMRYESGRSLRAGQVEAGAYWRNEYRAQKTSWEREIMQAVRADNGPDDLVFVLNTRHRMLTDTDIVTAYDHVIAQWPL